MSVGLDSAGRLLGPTRRQVETVRRVALRALVGDRLGLVLWLGTVVFLSLYFRVGFFITDNHTLANTIIALADGSLSFERATFGSLESPGTHLVDGKFYGRNYGQIAFAVPFLWGLRGLATVADPGVAFASIWSLLVLALGIQVGRLRNRPALGATVGSAAALACFAANVAVAAPIQERLFPIFALQLSAMVATAFVGTTLYRLVARLHGRRIGAAAGVAVVVATPIGFWGSVPKRHVYVAALVLGVAYALYRSRGPVTDGALSATGFRAVAYALVGLLTWIHAGEGFVVFLALVAVDFPTAPSNDPRTLAVVGAAFALSMLPFFATNVLISGDPVTPPRSFVGYGDPESAPGFGGGSEGSGSGSGGTSGSGGGSGSIPLIGPVVAFASALVAEALWLSSVLLSPLVEGVSVFSDDPGRLYRIFVRGGYLSSVAAEDSNQAVYMTVAESAPLAGGLVASVGAVVLAAGGSVDRLRRSDRPFDALVGRLEDLRTTPVVAADAFAVLAALGFLLIYSKRLPLHATVTVRYLLVVFPLAVYGIARTPPLRRAVTTHRRLAAWSYAGGVLVGAQLFFTVVALRSFGRGEAFQLHALVGLAAATLFALFAVASVLDDRADRATAVTGGLAAALGTDFLLLSGLVYYQYGSYALPLSDALARLLGGV